MLTSALLKTCLKIFLFANYVRQKPFNREHIKLFLHSKQMRRVIVFVKRFTERENPLINIQFVVLFVTGCEIDVILVRMKRLPHSLDIGMEMENSSHSGSSG